METETQSQGIEVYPWETERAGEQLSESEYTIIQLNQKIDVTKQLAV